MTSWISLFTERLTCCNPELEGRLRLWFLPTGTRFGDERLWWGERKKRIAPHEGVDLVYCMDQQGAKHQLAPGLRIPTVFSGTVVQMHRDFLNWSVYIRHEQFSRNGAVPHTVYGHVQPTEKVRIGRNFRAGETVALLEAYPRSTVPLHLHFTIARIPQTIPSRQLNWRMLSEHARIILVDPADDQEAQ